MRKKSAVRALDMRSIGRRLRNIISAQYGTVCSFADTVGVSPGGMYKIVRGKVTPDAQTLADICGALGCSVDFLLGVSTPESEPSEGYEAALLNVYESRSAWTRNQRLFLVYATMNLLTPEEEERLRIRLKGKPPA